MKKTPGDIIILHKCTKNNDHMMYGSWNMVCDRQNFLSFQTIFSLLLPSQPEKSKFWKIYRMVRYIIILHMCTINYNHRMYGSWDMKHDEQKFLSFWTIFCPFTPIVCTPPFCRGRLNLLPNFQRGGAWQDLNF